MYFCGLLSKYTERMDKPRFFDEMFGIDGEIARPAYQLYDDWYKSEDATRLRLVRLMLFCMTFITNKKS
ncbi:MAG: hypothetical protein EBX05_10400 [Rhodobacteraceae bacterium]|nr:hypothetical protein [Paracoccaceae bacterium]